MSNLPDDFPEIDWTVAPDPHEIAQLREQAKWPLWEKLEWLESAQIMVDSMNAYRLKQVREAASSNPDE